MTMEEATALAAKLADVHPRNTFKVQAISDSWGGGYQVEQHGPCPECGKDLGWRGLILWDQKQGWCPRCVNVLAYQRQVRADHIAMKLMGVAE